MVNGGISTIDTKAYRLLFWSGISNRLRKKSFGRKAQKTNRAQMPQERKKGRG
jgi:hypothetical protein